MPRIVEVTILGSSGGIPTPTRSLPAILLRDWMGNTILMDAGEGVQYSLMKVGIPPTRIDVIAITHPHGDHINGLPGLLQSMYMHDRRRPLLLLGSKEVIEFVEDTLDVGGYRLGFRVDLHVVRGTGSATLLNRGGDKLEFSWAPACHGVESYAYRVEWRLRPRIDGSAFKKLLGGDAGLLKRLLEEGRVELEGGRTVSLEEVVRERPRSLAVVYTGDTAEPCETVISLSRGARLLIHDATFTSDLSREAWERGHSTGAQAARAAALAGVYLLVLTHVSARYRGREARRILEEARRIFDRVLLAWDGLRLLLGV